MTQASQLRPNHSAAGQDETYLNDPIVPMSFLYRQDQTQGIAPQPLSTIADTWTAGTRYCDQPMNWRSRLFGMGGTATVFALIVGVALFTWRTVAHINLTTTERLVVVNLAPLAAPAGPLQEVAPGPRQVERQEAQPEPKPDMVVPIRLVQLPLPSILTGEKRESVKETVDPGPPVPETTAPKSVAAPAASRVSNNTQADWEGQIMAHLERFRRYPARARASRQQGTVFVRFKMNRAGMLLSSAIHRGSGSYTLDQAALETFQRAQPLPAIPENRPDVVELTIPVEFFLR